MTSDLRLIIFWIIVLLILGPSVLLGKLIGSRIEYSEGFRDGTIQKVSTKGILFKTVEGEMILGGVYGDVDGNMQATFNREHFRFSVKDSEVASKLSAIEPGKKVRLHYSQKLCSWSASGDTDYFITGVEEK